MITILCLSSYFKGGAFLEECKRHGCYTILVTSQDLEHEAWPREAIDEFFVMPFATLFKQPDITHAIAYLARTRKIDRIIALDDFDVETVADLREHLRMPGMGGSTARYFRDKLAMRVQARDEGIPVPPFVHVLNYAELRAYMDSVPSPWVLKPRSEASSMGIRKVNSADDLWPAARRSGRSPVLLCIGAVCARRCVPRRLDCLEQKSAFHRDQPVWIAADDRLPGRRRLCH
jgi:biotin carboxylase